MINYQLDDKGIATLTWDMPVGSQNGLQGSNRVALISAIEKAVQDSAVRGIALRPTCTEEMADSAHANLPVADVAQELFARTMAWHRALRQLETCGKPVAAALAGAALGGALEIALATHYRVAADNAEARLGLPDVTLGLMPGGGATQRLPRLIGIQLALPLLLEGKRLDAEAALKMGLIHALVPAGDEVSAARAWLLAQTAPVQQPWDAKGFRIPGGAVSSPAVQQLLMAANAMLRAKTFGNYPAPEHIMSCVYEGLITDIDTGLKTEARHFVHSLLSGQTRA